METIVLMLTYNEAERVERALLSLVKQTDQEFELVIVDDGSTDGTPDIATDFLDRYMDQYDFDWSISINEENLGLIGNCQRAIEFIEEYRPTATPRLVRLDGDDEFMPNAVADLKKAAGWTWQNNVVFGDYFEVTKEHIAKFVKPQNLYESLACGVMMPLHLIKRVGGLAQDDVGIFVEYDLYARLQTYRNLKQELGTNVIKIDSAIYRYHRRPSSVTGNQENIKDSLHKLEQKWGHEIVSKIRSY